MTKPIVQYKNSEFNIIKVGYSAYIKPIDHPSALVSNTKLVRTSRVIAKDIETGDFETENTKYILNNA